MKSEGRSRLVPIVKRVAVAVAIKKGIDKFQEARRPQKPSFFGRVAKLGLLAAGGGGLFYAFVNGKLQPMVDKVMGASDSSSDERWSSSSPPPSSSV
ncbi:MAG: hypothetical protein M3P01_08545 [Actinomycetota bacterium]|nr:hypothetical protein [Actinomycetota bacterium]